MKRISIIVCLLLSAFAFAGAADAPQNQQLLAAIKEIQTQQVAIAENHAKIEAKLAAITEAVRVARIYSSRSGN